MATTEATPERAPIEAAEPTRERPVAAAIGFAAGSMVWWSGTAVLRWYVAPRLVEIQCHEGGTGERCNRLDSREPRVLLRAMGYATVAPAIGMMGLSGYYAGLARTRPVRAPRATLGIGGGLAAAGTVVWLVPRIAYLGTPWADQRHFEPTFFAGLGLVGVGIAMIAHVAGDRERRHPWTPGRPRVSLAPTGSSLTGRF